MNRLNVSLGLIGFLVAPALVHAHGGDQNVVHTCVQHGTHQVRIVAPSVECRAGETAVHRLKPAGPPERAAGAQAPGSTPASRATDQPKKPGDLSTRNAPGASSGGNPSATIKKLPGAGGATDSQTQQSSAPATPTSTTLVDPRKPRPQPDSLLHPQGVKEVGPEYFKSKDQQLMELAKPGMPAPETALPGGDSTKKKLEPSGADILGAASTTPTLSQGKNTSSKREQQSSGESRTMSIPGTSLSITGTVEEHAMLFTLSGGRGSVTWRFEGTRLTEETVRTTTKENGYTSELVMETRQTSGGQSTLDGRAATRTTTITVTHDATGEKLVIVERDNGSRTVNGVSTSSDGRSLVVGSAIRNKTMPNPETGAGTPVPQGGVFGAERAPKSPGEVEAERKRQVTLSDDQKRMVERVTMEAKAAVQGAMARRTDGRINPGSGDASAGTGTRGSTGLPGTGCERVDCVPQPGAPNPGGSPGGGRPRTN
jgi:hypothetical protein